MPPVSLFMYAFFLCSVMVQYHALGVLYHIRKSDRLAVNKLVAKLTRMSLKSPYAVCMLVSMNKIINSYFAFENVCIRVILWSVRCMLLCILIVVFLNVVK
jgi:hypothetical protein